MQCIPCICLFDDDVLYHQTYKHTNMHTLKSCAKPTVINFLFNFISPPQPNAQRTQQMHGCMEYKWMMKTISNDSGSGGVGVVVVFSFYTKTTISSGYSTYIHVCVCLCVFIVVFVIGIVGFHIYCLMEI